MNENLVDNSNSETKIEDWKKVVIWCIRILMAGMFFLSAYAKIYPSPSSYATISTFEVKQLYTMGFTEMLAKYFSRTLIGMEFALGVLMLLPFNLKKWVIPATILMLGVFCIELSYEIATVGNHGNCGCFGALLPMTPLAALTKNLISIGLLTLLLTKFHKQIKEQNNFLVLTNIAFACILAVFMAVPLFKKPTETMDHSVQVENPNNETDTSSKQISALNPTTSTTQNTSAQTNEVKPVKPIGPPQKKSGYAKYFADVDNGKQILCFFAPSCDHCKNTAKELTQLKKSNPDFPTIQILFMDEAAEEIPSFFEYAGAKYNYKVLDIIEFWNVLGSGKDTPGVAYFWNGKNIKFYYGTTESGSPSIFNKNELEKLVKKESW